MILRYLPYISLLHVIILLFLYLTHHFAFISNNSFLTDEALWNVFRKKKWKMIIWKVLIWNFESTSLPQHPNPRIARNVKLFRPLYLNSFGTTKLISLFFYPERFGSIDIISSILTSAFYLIRTPTQGLPETKLAQVQKKFKFIQFNCC